MKKIMSDISKEILQTRQEAHVIHFKTHELQIKLNEAFSKDDSHTKVLSQ